MVRRLKVDLRALGYDFPERRVVQLDVPPAGGEIPVEVTLSDKLAEYTELMKPKKGRGKLAFISLQKRLLSSVYAFDRTLALHVESVAAGRATTQLDLSNDESALPARADDEEEDAYGIDEETEEATLDAEVRAASRSLPSPEGRARTLLAEMQQLAAGGRNQPDAKVRALLAWIQGNQCAGVAVGGARGTGKDLAWTDRRVIVFTEYGDTKRYLVQLLRAAVSGTEQADDRILQFQGGMDDELRDQIQRKFNSPPGDDPVRILIATDAAREGINLQGHCADLFHFDVPWNPARMEQRNGRIDRTLQTAKVVRCHYFFYPARREDVVLKRLIDKVDIIQRELGSLGSVVLDQLGSAMESGIDADTGKNLDAAEVAPSLATTAKSELESQRKDRDVLRKQIEDAGRILNASRKIMDFDPALLRDAIDVGLELAGASRLERIAGADDKAPTYRVPPLSASWQPTLDHLRPARGRDEPLWDWRKKAPLPVVFKAPDEMNAACVHMHLQHPFVQRILSRFVAEGFSTFDLSRVTVVRNPHDSLVRVVAFGRLSLFGPSATRLHDQLVSVAAPWFDGGGETHLKPFTGKDDRKSIDQLEELLAASPKLEGITETARARLQASAADDFAKLFAHIKSEADALAHDAAQALTARGAEEAEALRQILTRQKKKIVEVLDGQQMDLFGAGPAPATEKEQREQDKKHMQRRLAAIDGELQTEPGLIEDLYRVVLHRLEPVGLVYLWPETRA
jgi:hypothetical protein